MSVSKKVPFTSRFGEYEEGYKIPDFDKFYDMHEEGLTINDMAKELDVNESFLRSIVKDIYKDI